MTFEEVKKIPSDTQDRIWNNLKEIGALRNCSRCGHNAFSLSDYLGVIVVQDNVNNLKLQGRSLPCIIVHCTFCGNMIFHNAITLGFMNRDGEFVI